MTLPILIPEMASPHNGKISTCVVQGSYVHRAIDWGNYSSMIEIVTEENDGISLDRHNTVPSVITL